MKRRDFIKNTGALASAPLLLNGVSVKSMNHIINTGHDITDRVLVVIQLFGGNDGLNTFIPINQYDEYKNNRPDIAIENTGINKYIDLDSSLSLEAQVGLHPIMTGLKDMYDDGLVNIIHGVSYPSQSRSHFHSTDIWMSGDDGNADILKRSGIAGRYLQSVFPDVKGVPSSQMQDPPGIQLGSNKPSLYFHTGEAYSSAINLSSQTPNGLFETASQFAGNYPSFDNTTDYGKGMEYLVGMLDSTNQYSQVISNRYDNGSNSTAVTYPTSSLANQLKTVARLISGGSKTKLYLLRADGSYDTHGTQAETGATHTGRHADLLYKLTSSIKAFMDDIKNLGVDDRVMGTIFSEFGRQVPQNASYGTDHGSLNHIFVFGKPVKAGVTGQNVNISDLVSKAPNPNQMQTDYRQLYATLYQDWLGASSDILNSVDIQSFEDQKLDIIDDAYKVNQEDLLDNITNADDSITIETTSIKPNPARDLVAITIDSSLTSSGGTISVLDLNGLKVHEEKIEFNGGAANVFTIDVSQIPQGQYIVHTQIQSYTSSKKILISRA